MANKSNGTATTTRQRDYGRLLDDTSLMRDGLEMREQRIMRELRRLLGNHQHATEILTLLTRPGDGLAVVIGKRSVLDAKIKTYQRALDVQNATSASGGDKDDDTDDDDDDNGHDVPADEVVATAKVKAGAAA